MKEIHIKVTNFLVNYLKSEGFYKEEINLNNNCSFKNDLGLDSLDFSSMILDLEKEFNIVFPNDLIESSLCENFDGLVNEITKFLFAEGYE